MVHAVTSYSLKIGNYYITSSDGTNQEITGEIATLDCKETPAYQVYADGTAIYFNPETNQKCSEEEYQTNINNNGIGELKTGCMKWYTFNDNRSSTTVNMLLNHNTTNDSVWVEYDDYHDTPSTEYPNSDKGPITLNNKLQQDITSWNNSVKSTTRLISAEEIAKITGADTKINWKPTGSTAISFYIDTLEEKYGNNEEKVANFIQSKGRSDYAWLFNYTYQCKRGGCEEEISDNVYGYWTSTNDGGSSQAWTLNTDGG